MIWLSYFCYFTVFYTSSYIQYYFNLFEKFRKLGLLSFQAVRSKLLENLLSVKVRISIKNQEKNDRANVKLRSQYCYKRSKIETAVGRRYNENQKANTNDSFYNTLKFDLKKKQVKMQHQVKNQAWKMECLAQWDKQCLKSNEGFQIRKKSQDQMQTYDAQHEPYNEITHNVGPGDTLEGISLLYNVPIDPIKQRNKLHSNDIYYLSQLIIPNGRLIAFPDKQPSEEQKLNELLKKLHKSPHERQEGRRILAESGWNVERAIAKYHGDVQWERENSHILQIFRQIKI